MTKQQQEEWGNIFTNFTSDRRLTSKIYKDLKKLDINKPNSSIKKSGADLNREFTTEKSQLPEKCLYVQHS